LRPEGYILAAAVLLAAWNRLEQQAADIINQDVGGIWIAAVNDVICFTDTLGGLAHEPHYLYVYWPHDLYREK